MDDLLLIESDRRKYADLFAVQVDQLIVKGDGEFLFYGLLEFL